MDNSDRCSDNPSPLTDLEVFDGEEFVFGYAPISGDVVYGYMKLRDLQRYTDDLSVWQKLCLERNNDGRLLGDTDGVNNTSKVTDTINNNITGNLSASTSNGSNQCDQRNSSSNNDTISEDEEIAQLEQQLKETTSAISAMVLERVQNKIDEEVAANTPQNENPIYNHNNNNNVGHIQVMSPLVLYLVEQASAAPTWRRVLASVIDNSIVLIALVILLMLGVSSAPFELPVPFTEEGNYFLDLLTTHNFSAYYEEMAFTTSTLEQFFRDNGYLVPLCIQLYVLFTAVSQIVLGRSFGHWAMGLVTLKRTANGYERVSLRMAMLRAVLKLALLPVSFVPMLILLPCVRRPPFLHDSITNCVVYKQSIVAFLPLLMNQRLQLHFQQQHQQQ
eukprot:m.129343 g.129343  ORF g.129343 m.129343 type:complete len:389 (+) comp13045_c0_seq2:45-1211(+)